MQLESSASFLYQKTGIEPTEGRIITQIRIHNRMRRELKRVVSLAAAPRGPLTGLQLMMLMESKSFVTDIESYTNRLSTLRAELEEIIAAKDPADGVTAGRILLTGCPVGKGCDKVIRLVEEAGAAVVCMENCTGMKPIMQPVAEDGDPVSALAHRYLNIPCSC